MKATTIALLLFMLLAGTAAADTSYPGNVTISGNLDVGGAASISGEFDQIGNLTNLTTDATDDLVVALNSLDTSMEANDSRITVLEGDLGSNDSRITVLEGDLGANDSRIATLESYVSKFSVIAGGAAGNHTLTGAALGDALGGVAYVKDDTYNLTAVSDLTSEFTGAGKGIIDDDVVANGAGTDTTGGYLIISWVDKTA